MVIVYNIQKMQQNRGWKCNSASSGKKKTTDRKAVILPDKE